MALDWRKLTHDFSLDFIEAFIAMQDNRNEKIAVADMILEALHSSTLLFGDQTAGHVIRIKQQIEKGVFSPYQEIERLIDEGKYKDAQIDEKMNELKIIRQTGNKQQEDDLLQRIVAEAKTLGQMGALYTEVMLRRIYPGESKCIDELRASSSDKLAGDQVQGNKTSFGNNSNMVNFNLPDNVDYAKLFAAMPAELRQKLLNNLTSDDNG